MRRPVKASDLLHLADNLSGRTAGRGRPRTAYLRRATSTAYYALFHELVRQGAQRAARNGPEEHRRTVGRWYAHGNFKKVSMWVDAISAGRSAPDPVVPLLTDPVSASVPADLRFLATSFAKPQMARHGADYDSDFDVTRAETLEYIDVARLSIEAIRRMDKANLHQFDMFLLLALGGDRMIRNG